jgi:hypothetical protein
VAAGDPAASGSYASIFNSGTDSNSVDAVDFSNSAAAASIFTFNSDCNFVDLDHIAAKELANINSGHG